jgi:hypothetical protein
MTIQDLKRGESFKFNDEIFLVTRKFIDDDRPLIATDSKNEKHSFYWEGLEVEKINQPPHR